MHGVVRIMIWIAATVAFILCLVLTVRSVEAHAQYERTGFGSYADVSMWTGLGAILLLFVTFGLIGAA